MQRIVDETFRRGRFVTQLVAAACLIFFVSACGTDDTIAPPPPPRAVAEPSGALKLLELSTAFDAFAFAPLTKDDAGANDYSGQNDLNVFTRADNVSGRLGVAWTWDDINSWTGTGQTGDACALFDTDAVGATGSGNADYAVCVRITNPGGDPTQIDQLPAPESPVIYSCSDKKTDRCTTTFTIQQLNGSFCEVHKSAENFPAGDDGFDVLAGCSINLAAIGNPSRSSLLNVCSFPSGSPNSNPFDCVVTPGSGFVQIKKKTSPQSSNKTFSFTLSPAASDGNTSFNILDDSENDEATALIPVAPGTFSITESTIPSGWSLSAVSCTGAGTNGSKSGNAVTGLVVAVGETAICTFENTQSGSITIVKDAKPNDAQDFDYTSAALGSFSLDDDGAGGSALSNTRTFSTLAPGSRTITETGIEGWTITNIACTGNVASTVTIGAAGGFDAGDNAVTINLAAGESVSCTFENTKKGSITIVKDAIPNDIQDFDYTSVALGSFSLDDDGAGGSALSNTKAFPSLLPGVRTISEGAVSGWTITNISCTGNVTSVVTIGADGGFAAGDNAVTIDLKDGENVSCTFENTKLGSITIVKNAIPDDAQDFSYTSATLGNFSLDDDQNGTLPNSQPFTALLPGVRTVTEGAVGGWTISNISCTGNSASIVTIGATGGFNAGDNAVTIDLKNGENVTCTFENTKGGSLTIVKDAKPNAATDFGFTVSGAEVTPFTLDDDSDPALSNSQSFPITVPGSRTITETGVLGWTITNISCTGQVASTVTIGASGAFDQGDNAVMVNLAAGENVSCTFENTKQGSITIVKDAIPNDAQDFSYTSATLGSFSLDDDSNGTLPSSQPFTALLPGVRTVTEGAVGGWTITNISCTGNVASTVTVGAVGGFNTGDNAVTIDLKDGENVTCTFENTRQGSIKIVKDAVPDNAQDFAFTPSGFADNSGFSLDDDANATLPNFKLYSALLPGGARTVSEGAVAGWAISNITCTGATAGTVTIGASGGFNAGDNSVTINLAAGDNVVCTFENTAVAPGVDVTKTANPTSIPETGGNVTYTVKVKNTSLATVTLTTLTDDKFGNLNGKGTGGTACAVPQALAPDQEYTCSFTEALPASNAGLTHTNVVTANVNNAGGTASDTDDAVVTYTNVNPSISVTKSANPASISTPLAGVLTFPNPDRVFTSNPPPPGGSPGFVSPTCDDGGANDINSAQVDLNCFNRADNVTDRIFVRWTWDDINAWGGGGSTGDGCALLDTDNDGNANVAVCARITNNPDGTIAQVGGANAADVYICNDTKTDRCAKQVSQVTGAAKGATKCTIQPNVENGFPAGDDGFDTQATCEIDRTMSGAPIPPTADLLNVCSFPSGEPNSNPFDCVVQVGAGFIQIVKTTNLTTTQQFGFTLSPSATDGSSKYVVQGGITSGLIPVMPTSGNTGYSLIETLPTNWLFASATCVVDGVTTGTATTNGRLNIAVKTGQTTVCTFNNTGQVSGSVEYTVTVTNLGLEAVSLFSLSDDKFGNLNGVGTCATGGTIVNGTPFSCRFTKTLTGTPGTSHTNEVTAVAKDDETPQNSDTKKASATVNFVSPP